MVKRGKAKKRVNEKGSSRVDFGELFSQSWKDYKLNFKTFLWLTIIFILIPSLVFSVLIANSMINIPIFKDLLSNQTSSAFSFPPEVVFPESTLTSTGFDFSQLIGFLILMGIGFAVLGILYLILSVILTYISVYSRGKKISFKESFKGLRYFWKYIGLMLILFLFVAGAVSLLFIIGILFGLALSLLSKILVTILVIILIVLGIYLILRYFIYWAFSIFFLVGENKGMIQSLKESKKIVEGKWWKIFGYAILLGIVMSVFSYVFSLISSIFTLPLYFLFSSGSLEIKSYFVLSSIIGTIFNALASLLTVPFSVLFFKNFYLALKK